MNPSADQIEKWAEHDEDGWVRIPASSWPELLWCLRQAEKAEAEIARLRVRGGIALSLIPAAKAQTFRDRCAAIEEANSQRPRSIESQLDADDFAVREINEAIIARWSMAALRYIKEKAWKLAEAAK